jgi:hypothetical protein
MIVVIFTSQSGQNRVKKHHGNILNINHCSSAAAGAGDSPILLGTAAAVLTRRASSARIPGPAAETSPKNVCLT